MKKEHKKFLEDLRESGSVNMFQAHLHLALKFGITAHEAKEILIEWMKTYKE